MLLAIVAPGGGACRGHGAYSTTPTALGPSPVAGQPAGNDALAAVSAGMALTAQDRALIEGCRQGYAESCLDLGNSIDRDTATDAQFTLAMTAFTRACDLSSQHGCLMIGAMYDDGHGELFAPNQLQAVGYYDRGCQLGDQLACGFQGSILVGGEGGVPQDISRGLALMDQSCQASEPVPCHELGEAYDRGDWVPRSPGQAAAAYQRACELEHSESCTLLCELYRLGDPPAASFSQAEAVCDQGCRLSEPMSCIYLGDLYFSPATYGFSEMSQRDRALGLWLNACDAGEEDACGRLQAAASMP